MSHSFATPAAPSGGMILSDYEGSLLLVHVLGVEEDIPNINSKPGEKSPAVRANVTILDGPHAETIHEDTLVWPKVLQSQLRSRVGELVLGRLGKGTKKEGKNAPWVLKEATAEDIQVADAWINKQAKPTVASAEPPF